MHPFTRRLFLAAPAAALLGAQPVPPMTRKVFVDKMFGLEPLVEMALKEQELAFEFVEERNHPELKAQIRKKHSSFYGEILYRQKYGRDADHTLELYDVEKKKVVAYYDFKLVAAAAGREAIAREFARRVAAAAGKKQ